MDSISEKDKSDELELIRLGAIDCGDKTIEESACVQEATLSTSQEKLEGIQGPESASDSAAKGGGISITNKFYCSSRSTFKNFIL